MRRWTWAIFVLSAIAVAVAFTVLPIGGSRNTETLAHVITGTPGVNLPHVEIDMVKDGSNWCSPVDPVGIVAVNQDYTVAICLTGVPPTQVLPDAGGPPSAIQFTLKFNTQLNSCIVPSPVCATLDPGCYDSNPDANLGVTIFNGTGLGDLWTCAISSPLKPKCDNTAGTATILCNMTDETGTLTLPVGYTTSWPLAVVKMHSLPGAGGVDNIILQNTEIDDTTLLNEVKCFGPTCAFGAVFGATDYKGVTPTATPAPPTNTPGPPTATFTPTETPTPEPTATFTPLPTPYADIDKIPDDGTWCDPVDDASTEVVGTSHSLAVCAHNMPDDIAGFDLHITYDNGLDDCDEIDCTTGTCVDDNPELAAALGAGWDCTTSGQPVCDTDSEAYIHCSGPGSIQSGPLAILNLDVIAAGTDNVAIHSLVVYNADGVMAECGVADGGPVMECLGAKDTKEEPSPTPTITNTPPPTATPTITQTPSSTIRHRTATPKPTATEEPTVPPPTNTPAPPPATPTPLGGVGTQLVPPETGSGSTGVAFSWLLALLAGTAGIAALAGGGFYLRFARRRVR